MMPKELNTVKQSLVWQRNITRALALALFCLSVNFGVSAQAPQGATRIAPAPVNATVRPAASIVDESLRLVTEFDVNGLKVLVKRREGSQTVVCGLFLRGGSRNVTAENAGV